MGAHAAAQQTFSRYAHALNRGTADEVGDCFTEDAVLHVGARTVEGRSAIRDFYGGYVIDDLRSRCDHMRHRTSSVHAVEQGGVVTAVCYFDVDGVVVEAQDNFWGNVVAADSIVSNAGRYEAEIIPAEEQFRMLSVFTEWASVRPRVQGES